MAYSNFPTDDSIFTAKSRFLLYEDFRLRPALKAVKDTFTAGVTNTELVAFSIANKDFDLLGTNAVTASITYYAHGGVNLVTAGGATDSAIFLPSLVTNLGPWAGQTWDTSKEPWWTLRCKTNTALTNTTIWAGLKLTNTPVIITDDDQCWFRYQQGTDTNFQALYSIAGVDVAIDTGILPVVSTEYCFQIRIDSARIPRFFINGALVGTGTALTSVATLKPYVGVLSATDATAKTLVVRDISMSRNVS